MPEGGMGTGDGGTSAPSTDYQILEVLGANAAVYIDGADSDEDGLTLETIDEYIAEEGTITETEISGTYIYSATIGQWNKTQSLDGGQAGVSGIIIRNTSDSENADDEVLIGGSEDVYTITTDENGYSVAVSVEDGVEGDSYNTVIILDDQDGDESNDLYNDENDTDWTIDETENSNCTFPGVGIAVSANKLTIQNTYVETSGSHRPALITYDSVLDSSLDLSPLVIIEDSTLISWGSSGEGSSAPSFTCLYGSARPFIINASSDTYIYNSEIISSDWGSYSLDQCSGAHVYIVNSYNANTVGGYGVYAIGADNWVYMYGTTSVSAQYGAIICAAGTLNIYNLEDALDNETDDVEVDETGSDTANVLSNYDGEITMDDALNEGGITKMIGITSAVTYTADMSGAEVVSTLNAEDTYFSTLLEDAVYEDEQLVSVLETNDWATDYDSITNGAAYFFLHHIDGSTLSMRSVNTDLNLTNCELVSRTGVVIQTVLGYDTSASNIDVADGDVYYGYVLTLNDMDVEGDILHEDYQRQMTLTLNDTNLTGAVVTGTMASWNENIEAEVAELWDTVDDAVTPDTEGDTVGEALEADGIAMEDTIATLEKNDSYETFWGASLVMNGDSTWTVTDTSSLSSLTLNDNATVVAPDGYSITVYANVDMDNSMTSYDVTTGEVVDELVAGTTYENVVIVVTAE